MYEMSLKQMKQMTIGYNINLYNKYNVSLLVLKQMYQIVQIN